MSVISSHLISSLLPDNSSLRPSSLFDCGELSGPQFQTANIHIGRCRLLLLFKKKNPQWMKMINKQDLPHVYLHIHSILYPALRFRLHQPVGVFGFLWGWTRLFLWLRLFWRCYSLSFTTSITSIRWISEGFTCIITPLQCLHLWPQTQCISQ